MGKPPAVSRQGDRIAMDHPIRGDDGGSVATGAGESKARTNDAISHNWARWLPDGTLILFSGNEPNRGVRLYLQEP